MTFVPKPVNRYKGPQAIINSDRIVFNAKKDSILLYSDKVIGFNTGGSIFFDTGDSINGENKIVMNSPKIYIGLRKDLEATTLPTERAVLGTALRKWLNSFIDEVIEILDAINAEIGYADSSGQETTASESNQTVINLRKQDLETLREDLSVDENNELSNPDDCVFLSNTIYLANKD